MIRKKAIDSINVEVPTLGFGGMRLPTNNGVIDQETVQKMVDYAISNGINYFDTSYVYHGGKSEEALGKALSKYDRSSFFIADKMPEWECNKKEDAKRLFNEELERLGVDYIDFYLAHNLNPDNYKKLKDYEIYEFLNDMKKEGKIKYLGFSFHGTPELLEEILSNYKFDFAQIQLNYYDWTVQRAKEQYELLEKYNLPCIVMEGIRGGFLSNFNDEVNNIFKETRSDYSISSWALRWLISLPNVYVVLSGMSDMEQLKDNINTFTKYEVYTDNDYKVLDRALNKLYETKIVPCTGCKYCMPCPFVVNIPRIFSIYNEYCKTKDINVLKETYNVLNEKEKTSSCKGCKSCISKCPQRINVPEELARIEKEFKDLL